MESVDDLCLRVVYKEGLIQSIHLLFSIIINSIHFSTTTLQGLAS